MRVEEETIYVDEKTGQQVAPPDGATASYPPMSGFKGEKADLLDKIKPDVIVDKIRQRLLGKDIINGKWEVVEALKARALTPLGASDISILMLSVSSQNIALSKLNDLEIRNRTLEIVKTAQRMMLKNWKEYGIKGVDQLEFVHQIIMSNTFITLKQPEGGGIRDLLKGTTQEHRTYSDQSPVKRGFNLLRR